MTDDGVTDDAVAEDAVAERGSGARRRAGPGRVLAGRVRRVGWRPPGLGLRATVTVSFAAGALALSVLLSVGTYVAARHYLVDQRERVALRQAFVDASVIRDGLLTRGARTSDVIGSISPPAGSDVVLHRNGRWFSSSLREGSASVPPDVADAATAGAVTLAWTSTSSGPGIVVGVPLPAVRARFFEVTSTTELAATLSTLTNVLASFAVVTTLSGALVGRAASRRLVAPLDSIAGAAARIAVGELGTRLPATDDPDLAVIVGSFNSMVETLQERIERDARFAADLSHELRSPLTTLKASVDVLSRRREELGPRSQQALDLVAVELDRLHRSLEDLLELGRLDAGVVTRDLTPTDLTELVRHALRDSRRPVEVLDDGSSPSGAGAGTAPALPVLVDRGQLHRALLNLFGNAETHAGGLTAVTVRRSGDQAVVLVDDDGDGVAPADRERIFERFARAGSRGSRPGTGLGLSLVAETLRAHGGAVWCTEAPGGGGRFVVRLPLRPAGDAEVEA
ncbi:HAMP domain-containing sensor histidine kinase [Terrabacter sp. NPDC000476]|uniref:sensor histidine kinase n=1 Tax=Terrabacter sp. NPDC000476 TaxID=3154258 RepID=UPI003323F3CF